MTASSRRVPDPRVAPGGVREHLLVGVDGSAASVGALVWALQRAVENDSTVEVVTAWPLGGAVFVHEVPGHFCEARWNAVQAQAQAVAHAQSLVEAAPPYVSRLENAPALDALVEAAARGTLVVLGTDRGQQDPLEVGAKVPLTVRVQRLAACPVVLISHEAASHISERPVAVG